MLGGGSYFHSSIEDQMQHGHQTWLYATRYLPAYPVVSFRFLFGGIQHRHCMERTGKTTY
jgi:hypothetical protein